MKLNTEILKEFRADGSLMWIEERTFISPLSMHLYPNSRENQGKPFIRTGEMVKYKKDGEIDWKLCYDENGNVIGGQTQYKN